MLGESWGRPIHQFEAPDVSWRHFHSKQPNVNSSLQRSTLHRRQTGHSPIERSTLERSPLERSPRERSRTHRSRFDRSRFESRFECPPLLHTFAVVPAAEGWTRESAHRSACSKHIEAHVREACSNREASSNRELVRTRTPHEHAHEERKASQRRRRLQRTSNSPVVVLRSVLLIRIKKSDSPVGGGMNARFFYQGSWLQG